MAWVWVFFHLLTQSTEVKVNIINEWTYNFQDIHCSWTCEPMNGHFASQSDHSFPDSPDVVDVPICASVCDDMFEACKDDMTCIYDGHEGDNINCFGSIVWWTTIKKASPMGT